ncbi:hypothetical protein ANT_25990 [Anaerolinea thermophila UNI-1]|uniref:WXG100 family type VII secretion target n=2 Tax=Anaerolineaceae TaxID=292628 RepID=E8MZS7_ANATU|nr:hypothetical protein ANT_25990 [Anaerolinea thermophila UNI-1]
MGEAVPSHAHRNNPKTTRRTQFNLPITSSTFIIRQMKGKTFPYSKQQLKHLLHKITGSLCIAFTTTKFLQFVYNSRKDIYLYYNVLYNFFKLFQGGLYMTTLHMEVETARSTASNMANTYQQLIGLVQSMNSSVNNLQSAWMGNSATEFFGLYDQWRSSMNTILENLNTMTTKLQTEITEWEQMASNLS